MTSLNLDFATLCASLRKATVRVYDGERGAGSGTIWDASGTVLTNAHVVRGNAAEVEFENGRRERATVVRRDDARDLAALSIASRDLEPVRVRAAATLRPGELALAVGNPLGLVGAVTTGIVQRRNPRWVVADVRLAPGNSGGPLADGGGRVVGINSMVASGLAFAVPSEAVVAFLGARRLGIVGAPARVRAGRTGAAAFVVTNVEGESVAERSGLTLGDVIYGTDTGDLRAGDDVAATLAQATSLSFLRGGRPRTIALAWQASDRAATDAA